METETPQRAGQPERRRRHHPHDLRPRRVTLLILFVAFLVLAGGVVWAGSYWSNCKEATTEGAERSVQVSVEDGATAGDVVEELAAKGVMRCGGFVGNLLMRGTGKADDIRAGDYELTTGMSLDEVMTVLTTPPEKVPTTNVLIPPGYRLTQIADTMQEDLGIAPSVFMDAAQGGRYSLPPYLPAGTSTVEGFIWPETNRFPKHGTTPDDVITTGLQEFKEAVADLPWERAAGLHVTPYQVVTIASMIEKEALLDKDRPLISAVIYNRLREGMPLGIDAANAYIDPDPSDGLTDADFAIDSPYNTRLHTGLPPTPIASPSLESLAAALDPANVGYLYYVACGDGGHRFSVDYDTFLANKAECLG